MSRMLAYGHDLRTALTFPRDGLADGSLALTRAR